MKALGSSPSSALPLSRNRPLEFGDCSFVGSQDKAYDESIADDISSMASILLHKMGI